MRRKLVIMLTLLPLLAACGSRQVPLSTFDPTPSTMAPTATTPAAPDAVPTSVDELAPARRTPAGVDPSGGPVDYGDDGPADFNTMPLDVRLSAECAQPGQTMSATATTLPSSKLAFVASYSDNDFVPNFTYVPAEANPTGTFTWAWEITPTTPRGDSLVTVVASKEQKGASYNAPFRVADAC